MKLGYKIPPCNGCNILLGTIGWETAILSVSTGLLFHVLAPHLQGLEWAEFLRPAKASSPESCKTLNRVSDVTRFSPAVRTRAARLSVSSRFHRSVLESRFRTTHVRRASSPSAT